MSDDLSRAVDARIDTYRPEIIPPFEKVQARKRSRTRRRLAGGASALCIVALSGLGIADVSADGSDGRLVPGKDTTAATTWHGDYVAADRAAFAQLFGGSGGVSAGSEISRYESLREAQAASDLVVVGRLTSVVSTRAVSEVTYTAVRLEIDEVLSGSLATTSVLFEGGAVVTQTGSQEVVPTGVAIWFLHQKAGKESDYYRLVSSQGLFVPGRTFVESPEYRVVSPAPSAQSAPADDVDPLAYEASSYATLGQLADALRRAG